MARGIIAAIAAALCFWACPGRVDAVNIGDKAMPFEGQELNGETMSIAPYLGKKVILLKFGSIYCSSCVSSLEDVARIRKRFSEKDLLIVGVSLDVYGLQRVRRFYRAYSSIIRYPLIIDEKLAATRPYDIVAIPSHVIIDRQGIVRFVATGASSQDIRNMEEALSRIIRGDLDVERFLKAPLLQLFLPTNFTKTFQESINIVGKTRPGTEVALTLNGGSRQTVRTMRELFYIRTPLSLGSNYVELKAVDEIGERASQGVLVFREPRIGSGIESPFPEYFFHTEKNEAPCRTCHDLNPPAESAKGFATATQFCLVCHKELMGMKVVHGPIPIGGCGPCHQFSSKPHRYDVFAQGQELCFKCHEEKRKDLVKAYLHGPMSAGMCTICHSPHGSSEKFQVRRYVGDLCVMCHEGLKAQSARSVVHKPVAEGGCAKCHEAHSSPRNDRFLKFPGNQLCLSCHTSISRRTHSHPWGVPPKVERKIRLDKDGNLVCTSCHEPHGSDETKLLVKGGCGACHGT